LENGIINTGKVASARGLMLLRRKGKAVRIDVLTESSLFGISERIIDITTNTGDTGVVLVVLNLAEVVSITDIEAVVAIELEKTSSEGVNTGGIRTGVIEPRTIGRVATRVSSRVIASNVCPDKLLNGVVKVEGNVLGSSTTGDGLRTSELNLLDEVFVADLGEAATLISVKVDVINIELAADEGTNSSTASESLN